jgi:hypothetical protein
MKSLRSLFTLVIGILMIWVSFSAKPDPCKYSAEYIDGARLALLSIGTLCIALSKIMDSLHVFVKSKLP